MTRARIAFSAPAACVVLALLVPTTTPAVTPSGTGPSILLLGDSNMFGPFGKLLGQSLDEAGFTVHRRAKCGSGLAYPHFFDWLREAPALADRTNADVVVIILGGNDGQSLKPLDGEVAAGRIPWDAEDTWRFEYARRLRRLAGAITAHGRRLVVLSPTNRRPRRAVERLHRILSVQRETLEGMPSVHWIDTFSLTSGPDARYIARGPDDRGRTVSYRRSDGIHLTPAGASALRNRLLPLFGVALADYPNAAALMEEPL